MGTITGGTIKYGETRKMAEFENKRADVELAFNVAEGEDAAKAIEVVKDLARNHCHTMLAGVSNAPKYGNAPALAVAVAFNDEPQASIVNEANPLTTTKSRGRKPAPKMPAQEEKITTVEAEIVIPEPPAAPKAEVVIAEPVKDGITDAELMDATTKCQQKVMNAPAIRKLLNECGVKAPPGRIIDLPQDKRQTFLNGLNSIKPLA